MRANLGNQLKTWKGNLKKPIGKNGKQLSHHIRLKLMFVIAGLCLGNNGFVVVDI